VANLFPSRLCLGHWAAREIADRLEGKAVQPIVWDNTAGMSVALNLEAVRKKLFGDDE
jgi:phage-related protein